MTPIQPIGWVARASTPVADVFAPLYQELFRESLTTLALILVALIGSPTYRSQHNWPHQSFAGSSQALGQAEPVAKVGGNQTERG